MNRLYADLAALRMRLGLGLVKLMLKYNPNQPRVPAGSPTGGQWATGEIQLVENAPSDRGRAMDTPDNTSGSRQGDVVSPDGKLVANPFSATGSLISPVSDLRPVADAGKQAGELYLQMLNASDPDVQQAALPQLVGSIGGALGQSGRFDYQRSGNHLTGFIQLPQFRDVSNFNVGLYMQQTGQFSLDDTLSMAGTFSRLFSSNYTSDAPFGLDPRTQALIRSGYQAGASGVFGKAAGH